MSGKKKFVIKQYKQPAQVDPTQALRVWASLQSAIRQIHNQDASSLSFEELYRYAYNLVLHHHGDMLYQGVKGEVRLHLSTVADLVGTNPDETLLRALDEKWRSHKVTMVMIRDILMYMDRIYVVKKKKDKVYDFGLKLFRSVVVHHDHVRPRLRRLLLDAVRRERSGEVIDKGLIKNTLTMLVELGSQSASSSSSEKSSDHRSGSGNSDPKTKTPLSVYEEEFERAFLENTEAFYREESQRFIVENTCPVYLLKADARLQQERQRVEDYLNDSTAPCLRRIVEKALICDHAEALVNNPASGLVPMLRDNKVDDLKRMYGLFRPAGKLELLSTGLAAYVVKEGEALVTDTERARVPVEFAKKLLGMRDKYDNIVHSAFGGDKLFQRSLKNSFEKFMNMDTRCAQFLAVYVDNLLRHGIRTMSDEEIDETLDKVIVIFRFLTDKDVFEQFYKAHLQKRLLSGKSVSDDSERTMIAKLKTECGFQFTSKLEGMFQDMRFSKEVNAEFRRSIMADAGRESHIDISVTVLTTGFWPAQKVAPCSLPPRVAASSERFKAFYLRQHSGRRLTWQTNRGTADIRAVFGTKRHELNVTTYQMCILMLFNVSDKLTFQEILDATSIPEADCRRHLVSLCTPRSRILLKSRKGKDVQPPDEFQFNARFTSKLRRVKVPLISNKSRRTAVGGADTSRAGDTGGTLSKGGARGDLGGVTEAVNESRRHLVEAAIVRIMKTRKKLDNSNLVAEVTKQLSTRFRPSPQLIKKRIESLIEREYLERSETDRRIFHYVA